MLTVSISTLPETDSENFFIVSARSVSPVLRTVRSIVSGRLFARFASSLATDTVVLMAVESIFPLTDSEKSIMAFPNSTSWFPKVSMLIWLSEPNHFSNMLGSEGRLFAISDIIEPADATA